MTLATAGGLATPALADNDGPPEGQAVYYGEVTIVDELIPEGTFAMTVVDGGAAA